MHKLSVILTLSILIVETILISAARLLGGEAAAGVAGWPRCTGRPSNCRSGSRVRQGF